LEEEEEGEIVVASALVVVDIPKWMEGRIEMGIMSN
jgi:hypothetical protein